jgi:hypothetical protein
MTENFAGNAKWAIRGLLVVWCFLPLLWITATVGELNQVPKWTIKQGLVAPGFHAMPPGDERSAAFDSSMAAVERLPEDPLDRLRPTMLFCWIVSCAFGVICAFGAEKVITEMIRKEDFTPGPAPSVQNGADKDRRHLSTREGK